MQNNKQTDTVRPFTPPPPPPSSSPSSTSISPSTNLTKVPMVGKSPMTQQQTSTLSSSNLNSTTSSPSPSSSSSPLVKANPTVAAATTAAVVASSISSPSLSSTTTSSSIPPTNTSPLTQTQSKPLTPISPTSNTTSPSSSSSTVLPASVIASTVAAAIAEISEVPSIGMYEEIEDNSSEIVAFDELKGFGTQVKTQLSPRVGANLTISFPVSAGIALSYSSAPLSRVIVKKDSAEALTNPTLPPPLPLYIPPKSFYISAMLDPQQSFHLDYLHRYTPKLTWKLYGVTSLFDKDSTDLCGKLQFDKPKYNVQVKAATDNQYLGGSFLRKVNTNWYLGSELFYSNTQKSGGFSAGVQYFDKVSPYRPQWTTTANTMGDLTSTFTSSIVPSILSGSARFNFNTNSHESEIGAGIAYTPKDLPLTLKARWDNSNRWGVMATLKLAIGKLNLMATAGVSGGDHPSNKPSYGAVLSIEI